MALHMLINILIECTYINNLSCLFNLIRFVNIWAVCHPSTPMPGPCSSAASPTWASPASSTKSPEPMSKFSPTPLPPSPCTWVTPTTSTCVGRLLTRPVSLTILWKSGTPSRCRPLLPWLIWGPRFCTSLIPASSVVSFHKILVHFYFCLGGSKHQENLFCIFLSIAYSNLRRLHRSKIIFVKLSVWIRWGD